MRELGIGLRVGTLAALLALASVGNAQGVACDGAVATKAGRSGPCSPLATQIEALLGTPAVARAHWGVKVTALDGTPIYSMNEGQFFQPASNAKLFTTATALALLGGGTTFETQVLARGVFHGADKLTGDVVLVGSGDANLSARELPYVPPALRPKRQPGAPPLPEPDPLRSLVAMADQVAATGLKVVNGDVIGDDTLFPWQPYAEDWSIDDTVWGYGAPVSALTISDNQLKIILTQGATAGGPATVSLTPALAYYTVDISGLVTGAAKSGSHVQIERALGSKVLRVYGSIAVDAQPDEEEIAIHDPAEYAAVALKGMLEARGITVTGVARAKHALSLETKDIVRASHEAPPGMDWTKTFSLGKKPMTCSEHCAAAAETPATVLASHTSLPLREDVIVTNKVSQNLHAELFLHDVGSAVLGDGSTLGGARVVRAFLEHAGVDKDEFVFFDGSGLSGHDLVTPRATARLLQYAVSQPWFADWRRSLPIGGEDGSLAGRFPGAPLKDHVFAKTGTLGEARALSGYLECASGKTVIFSIMVGNHAPRNNSDREAMDKVVAAIAANN